MHPSLIPILLGGVLTAPTRVANLVRWHDAADMSSIAQAGGVVSQWNDKSSLANHVSQATGSKQPRYGAETLNSRPLVGFDGTDDILAGADTGMPSGTTDRTVFVVSRYTTLPNLWGGWSYGTTGTNNAVFGMSRATNINTQKISVQGWGTDYTSSVSAVAATAYQHTARLASGTLTQRVNGTQVYSGASSLDTVLASFFIGSETLTSNFVPLEAAEYIAYSRALAAGEIAAIENYLSNKWGTP